MKLTIRELKQIFFEAKKKVVKKKQVSKPEPQPNVEVKLATAALKELDAGVTSGESMQVLQDMLEENGEHDVLEIIKGSNEMLTSIVLHDLAQDLDPDWCAYLLRRWCMEVWVDEEADLFQTVLNKYCNKKLVNRLFDEAGSVSNMRYEFENGSYDEDEDDAYSNSGPVEDAWVDTERTLEKVLATFRVPSASTRIKVAQKHDPKCNCNGCIARRMEQSFGF